MMTRRDFFKGTGALIVGFALFPHARTVAERLPGSLSRHPGIDSWLRINADGTVTVLTGKIELGQGIVTAIAQIAAEELDVAVTRVRVIMADTRQTPDEQYTVGSRSVEQSGVAMRAAAAEAKMFLLQRASEKLDAPVERLEVRDGTVRVSGGEARVSYWELLGGKRFEIEASGRGKIKDPGEHTIVGRPIERLDIPAIVTGGSVYVQNLRMDGMLHARVLRPPGYGARLQEIGRGVEEMPGVVKLVVDGSFAGVIAEREEQAIRAWEALRRLAKWSPGPELQGAENLYEHLSKLPVETEEVAKHGDVESALREGVRLEATYRRPYHMHGSIGPSCAVAELRDGRLKIWTHSQGVFPLRKSLSELLPLAEEKIDVIGVQGSGCYGHNGADDVAADAALFAMRLPGRPIRVQWMRDDEHAWEPYGSAMILQLRASLTDAGRISAWNCELWSDAHATRGDLLAGRYVGKRRGEPSRGFLGGAHRNAEPLYELPNRRITAHYLRGPLRVSALRSLGAYANVFAIESFMDELAGKAGIDPVKFRLEHLRDERARVVLRRTAEMLGWKNERLPGNTGIAFARYKNTATYCGVGFEVAIEAGRLRLVRAVSAVDAGLVINPDGLANQIEGGIIQSASWTTKEQVRFDRHGVTSRDWDTYPILRFSEVPLVEVAVLDRPDEPPLGAGEASQGPASAAIANAVYRATGKRVRDLPITPDRLA